jgi:hypothetical protein
MGELNQSRGPSLPGGESRDIRYSLGRFTMVPLSARPASNACLTVCVVALQAPGDVAFTSLQVTYLADTPEGARSVGAVARSFECSVG